MGFTFFVSNISVTSCAYLHPDSKLGFPVSVFQNGYIFF